MKNSCVLFFLLLLISSCNPLQNPDTESDLNPHLYAFYDETSYLYGIKNDLGDVVVQPSFDYIGPSSEGLTSVEIDGKWGFINEEGTIVIKPEFDLVNNFSEDYAAVVVNSDFQFDWDKAYSKCDTYDEDCLYSFWSSERDNSFLGHWGYIYKNGSIVIDPEYDKANDFHYGLASVCKDNRCGFLDIYGNYKIQPEFLDAKDFSEGLALVQDLHHYWGFIDNTGNWIIEPKFSEAKEFSQGLAAVWDSGWGYIDKSGEFVIPPNKDFLDVENFDESGYAIVLVSCKLNIEYCRATDSYRIISSIKKSDYIKEDIGFVKITRNFFGDINAEKLKSFLLKISKNKTSNLIAKFIVFILASIIYILFFIAISKPIHKSYQSVLDKNRYEFYEKLFTIYTYILYLLFFLFSVNAINFLLY